MSPGGLVVLLSHLPFLALGVAAGVLAERLLQSRAERPLALRARGK